MTQRIKELVEQITTLEKELQREIDKEESKVSFNLKNGRVRFDKETLRRQREELISLVRYLQQTPILYITTAPIIYSVLIPALMLDLFVLVYQQINFRVYKIPLVQRSDYIVFDRQYLAYLNIIEKINCLYCSYFNGLMAYVGEVAARTEQFWCPIKHAKKIAYRHTHYDLFVPYGDEHYHEELAKLRRQLQEMYEREQQNEQNQEQ